MKRFQIAILMAAILCATGLIGKDFPFVAFVALAFLFVAGLGVAVPEFRFFGDFVCRGSLAKRQVALTFDDGPDARSTPQLLELLRNEKISAAFFCIGKHVVENPSLAAQIVREGHLIGNHSFAHSNLTNFYSTRRLQKELAETQNAIEKAAGIAPIFFRPPVGLSNPNTFRAAEKLNLKVIGWSVRSFDTVLREPKRIVSRIVREIHPGAIILLHDGNMGAGKLIETVKSLLDELRKSGYEIVRLDEILK
ncbi:MAG TPA: polysaccharide deacetylase family protein [Verrucomicrobiae bacterium]|nr:polysaccharide deacetylase family protein [Verrucomicrobiae bacterium]